MLPLNPENSTDTEASLPQGFVDEDDDIFYENGQREMTKEEEEIYSRVVSASQGFDVPYFPNTMAFGIIEPIIDELLKQEYAKIVLMAATISIEDYNNKNGSNYEVLEIIKANMLGVAGRIYFVTYSVKPANMPTDFVITIFQAKVYFEVCYDNIEILICRPKPNEGEKLAGDQVGLQCCC